MSQEELLKQNDLQQELIKSLFHLSNHLQRRVLMAADNDCDCVDSLLSFVVELPGLMEQRLTNFKEQGLHFEELTNLGIRTIEENSNGGKNIG